MSITVTILTADSVISLIDPFRCSFYPCDAMLAQVVAIALRLCHKSVFCWSGWTDQAGFGNTVCKEIQVSTKIRVLTSGILSKTPDLENFSFAYRSSRCVIDLAREGWTLICDKLDRHRSTKSTVPPSSDSRPLQFITWSSSSVYSTMVARVN